MRLGIFAKTFDRPAVEQVFAAVKAHGLSCVQFNLSCAGLPTLPDEIEPSIIARIRAAALASGVEIAAISGTYNMIHPDLQVQQSSLRRLRTLAAACRGLGTGVITLCTGTRDPVDMWRWHPENDSPQAWSDLLHAAEAALRIAEEVEKRQQAEAQQGGEGPDPGRHAQRHRGRRSGDEHEGDQAEQKVIREARRHQGHEASRKQNPDLVDDPADGE